ncbi:MAG: right-handed parallel beta-helix repeat-containing protein, partial [Myxococcales bacterium]|nr:right-handed parallel beta-helix repeat-containing protein [Myxococcales bacterium]
VDAATDRLDGVDDVLSASLDALTLRVATLEGADAAADVAREALTARADGLDQRLGVAEASVRTLGDGQRGLQDGVDEVAGALADLIGRQDLPVNVLNVSTVGGADTFPSVQAAFDYLADYRIRPGRLVQVRVQPGVYVSRQPLTIDHPDSERILLRGQGGDPTQVRLVFNGSDGLTVAGGHTFQVEGITFDGEPVEAGEARGRRGAVVADHGVLVLEQGVTFTRFNFGAQLDTGGTIRGTWGGRFVANENAGVTLSDGAFIDLAGAEISHNGEDGVACVRRCYLALNGARIEGNSAAGVIMSDGAVGDLSDAVVDSNTEFGVLAERGSVVNLANATIQRSGFAGVMVAAMSWGNVRQATIGGNNTRNLGTQAQLVAGETAWLAVSNNPDLAGNAPLTRPGIEVQVPLAPISVDND